MMSLDIGSLGIFGKVYMQNDHSLKIRSFFQYLTVPSGGFSVRPWVWLFPLFRTKQQVSCCLLLFHKSASAENESVCLTRAMICNKESEP